jgi:hypothetical protein
MIESRKGRLEAGVLGFLIPLDCLSWCLASGFAEEKDVDVGATCVGSEEVQTLMTVCKSLYISSNYGDVRDVIHWSSSFISSSSPAPVPPGLSVARTEKRLDGGRLLVEDDLDGAGEGVDADWVGEGVGPEPELAAADEDEARERAGPEPELATADEDEAGERAGPEPELATAGGDGVGEGVVMGGDGPPDSSVTRCLFEFLPASLTTVCNGGGFFLLLQLPSGSMVRQKQLRSSERVSWSLAS